MSADYPPESLTADIHKIAAETSVAMQHCQRTGQLSRYRQLSIARDVLYKAANMIARDERQLVLETATEDKPDANSHR